ncbi:MAG TPA: DNA ligase [Niallia sp.]|nr:DNA ligase [Niallia sp.]
MMKPVKPFEPIITDDIPIEENWVGQVKWDGTRILTYNDGNNTVLFNRKLNERTKQYPELVKIDTYFSEMNCILDGEVIALKNGKPSFYEVMKRDRLRNFNDIEVVIEQLPITYMVFDILYLNNEWLLDKPLKTRQELLEKVISPNKYVQLVPSFLDKEELYKVCMANDLEGVVYKDLTSTYVLNGKDSRWRKKKKSKDLVAVVGGVSYRNGTVNSLHLGLYNENKELVYIGSAGSGKLTTKDWKDLTSIVPTIIQNECPFNEKPSLKGMEWLRPALTVKVSFLEWTNMNTLRHPVIESFVTVPISECQF